MIYHFEDLPPFTPRISDPPPRGDGRCARPGCKKKIPKKAAADEVFCSTECCKAWHRVETHTVCSAEDTRSGDYLEEWRRSHDACKNGHEYTPENTKIIAGGKRTCRECAREFDKRRRRALPVAA